MNNPSKLKYTKGHDWLEDLGNGTYKFGITEYAQDALGDIVYVELPEVGEEIIEGDTVATVESVKAVSEIVMPFDCEIVEVNDELEDEPEKVNASCYEAWIAILKIESLDGAISAQEYEKSL